MEPMKRALPTDLVRDLIAPLSRANGDFAGRYPGESPARQPVHTVYGGAHLFRSDTAPRLGVLARAALRENAPDPATFAAALGAEVTPMWRRIYTLVGRKLETEPVEDFRIDFEDGYGNRPDDEEDAHAEAAAREVAKGRAASTLPPFIGIRIKPFTEELRDRSIRTLDIFLTTLVEGGGALPPNFVVTLPKVTAPEQVTALADLLDLFEPRLSLAQGALRFEIMVETPQSIIGADGRLMLPLLVAAGRGRCVSAHFGTYDYTAGVNITAAWQNMAHPACDFAKHVMQVALAGTGVWLSDGATNVMPIGGAPRPARNGAHRAWRLHYGHVRHSLEGAFYQGWDLHPAQLPTRYAAVYGFFLESQAGRVGAPHELHREGGAGHARGRRLRRRGHGQGLLNFFLRGISCGAISEDEVLATGITLEELRGRSFVKILKNRQGAIRGPRLGRRMMGL